MNPFNEQMNAYRSLFKQKLALLPHQLSSFQAFEFSVAVIASHFPVF